MTFRYPYSPLGPDRPPAPCVYLHVDAADGRRVQDLPALVDTGADQTVLPERVVAALGLAPFGAVTASGYDGRPETRPTYSVRLTVRDFPPVGVEVLGGWAESYALLGRDVLNRYKVTHDGPGQVMTISDDP